MTKTKDLAKVLAKQRAWWARAAAKAKGKTTTKGIGNDKGKGNDKCKAKGNGKGEKGTGKARARKIAAIRAEAVATEELDIEAILSEAQIQAEAAVSAALEALSNVKADMEPGGQVPLTKNSADTYNNLMIRAMAIDDRLRTLCCS